jgi:hypothetical protein
MYTLQILCALRDVRSFAGVFPSDLLPHSLAHACTVIINADPHKEKGSHWLAVQLLPKSSSAYYFDSYGMPPTLIPAIHEFIRRNSTVWDYKRRQLQGLTSNVCGKYCCLFALYASRGYGPRQNVGLLDAGDRQIERAFLAQFGPPLRPGRRSGCQCSCSRL